MRFLYVSVALVTLAAVACTGKHIRIVGSSTVYPFAASVSEHFGRAGDYPAPVVEATGTGAGFKLFCAGAGEKHPYITDASRAMLPGEREQCARNGITEIAEAKFGFDGITLAAATSAPVYRLSLKQIFLALSRYIPKDGKLVKNEYTRWNQIDPVLPDVQIKVYGTPPVSGTYDTFIELVMKKGCAKVSDFETLIAEKSERERTCAMLREDGRFVQVGENGNLIAEKVAGDPGALGILGFSFLDQNHGKIQGSIINGIEPTFETIQNGSYPISRLLYFYVKIPAIPGIREYVQEFMSEAAIGDEGYLVSEGLVPLPATERARVRDGLMAVIK